MSEENRRRLGATLALALGAFLALTLLPVNLTGPLGASLGPGMWRALGIGALAVPAIGVLIGLAGFGRLGRIDQKRAAILTVSAMILVPFVIGVLSRVSQIDFLGQHTTWSWGARATGWSAPATGRCAAS